MVFGAGPQYSFAWPEFRIAISGMAWKAEEGDRMVAMQASDIKWAQWIRVARNYQLRVGLKDRSKETFDGFVREVSQHRPRRLFVARIDFNHVGS